MSVVGTPSSILAQHRTPADTQHHDRHQGRVASLAAFIGQMSTPPDNALLAQLRLEVEAKVRAELSSSAQPLPPPLSSGAAGSPSGLPGFRGVLPAGSNACIGGAGGLGSHAMNLAQPQLGSPRSSSSSSSEVEVLPEGGEEKESGVRKTPTKWGVDKKRILMLQVRSVFDE